jgi:uncharacterized repeat protein (TIGR01451 family)
MSMRFSDSAVRVFDKLLIMDTLQCAGTMNAITLSLCGALLSLFLPGAVGGQVPASSPEIGPLEIKSIAEVESKASGGLKLVPAERVVPGDRVIYTLEARNTGATALDGPSIAYPIPEHMRYVTDSAVGPGAEVTYSVDGGRSFERAENLKLRGPDGRERRAVAADYTHIRWQLKGSVKANSVAFVRFRALVK